MRSRADVARRLLEGVLRTLALGAMIVLAVRLGRPVAPARVIESARGTELARALPRWTRQPPDVMALVLDTIPAPVERDWLRAFGRSGSTLRWRGPTLAPTALSVHALADPAGVRQIDVVAPRSPAILSDVVGVLDTVHGGATSRVITRGAARGATLAAGGGVAVAPRGDSLLLRRLLVEGAAGWETKFTVAALQERGWQVDAITHVAPGVDVRLGTPSALDTARYAAAVAVDTSARLVAAGATRFVASGGGLILLHDATGTGPRGAGTVELEHGPGGDVRGARFGSGRILRVGIPELWRMRMLPGDSADAAERHRSWIATAIASVAYAPGTPTRAARAAGAADPAPYADLVAAIGAPSADALSTRASVSPLPGPAPHVPEPVIAAVALGALLAEIVSRRARGAR